MRIVKQISVSVTDKPGTLSEVTKLLAENKISIIALNVSTTVDWGILHLVVDDPDKASDVLSPLHDIRETNVLLVEMPHKAGSIAAISAKLCQAAINIEYAYASTGAEGTMTTLIIKVPSPEKALAVLTA